MTYQFDKGRLVMPAIIERESGRWYYHHQSGDPEDGMPEIEPFLTLEHSHRKQATGLATMTGRTEWEGWYIYHEPPIDPDHPDETPDATLYLLGLDDRGKMIQQSRLIFGNPDTPYEQVYLTRQGKYDRDFATRVYQPIKQDPADADLADEPGFRRGF